MHNEWDAFLGSLLGNTHEKTASYDAAEDVDPSEDDYDYDEDEEDDTDEVGMSKYASEDDELSQIVQEFEDSTDEQTLNSLDTAAAAEALVFSKQASFIQEIVGDTVHRTLAQYGLAPAYEQNGLGTKYASAGLSEEELLYSQAYEQAYSQFEKQASLETDSDDYADDLYNEAYNEAYAQMSKQANAPKAVGGIIHQAKNLFKAPGQGLQNLGKTLVRPNETAKFRDTARNTIGNVLQNKYVAHGLIPGAAAAGVGGAGYLGYQQGKKKGQQQIMGY